MENNIFYYATSELSQDAVICWAINHFNCGNIELKTMAKRVIALFTDNNVNLDNETTIYIYRQIYKTDILLYFPVNNIIWIIEDKTYTTEHDEQISIYRDKIANLNEIEKSNLKLKSDYKIFTTYFKTGFFYDYDKNVKADVVVDGNAFYDILESYKAKSEIIAMYCDYYREVYIDYIEEQKKFYDTSKENFWEWNISRHHVAQYVFLETIFNNDFLINHGSSSGRPYSQVEIFNRNHEDEKYKIFWRLDTYGEGVTLSLRYYDWYVKPNKAKDEEEKQKAEKIQEKHIEEYIRFKQISEDVFNSNNFIFDKWEKVKSGNNAKYCEAELFKINLNQYLKNWGLESQKFIEDVRTITNSFIKKTKNI